MNFLKILRQFKSLMAFWVLFFTGEGSFSFLTAPLTTAPEHIPDAEGLGGHPPKSPATRVVLGASPPTPKASCPPKSPLGGFRLPSGEGG